MPKRVVKSKLLLAIRLLIDVVLSFGLAFVTGFMSSNAVLGITIGVLAVVFLAARTMLMQRDGLANAKFRKDTREQMRRIRVDASKKPAPLSGKALQDQIRDMDQKIEISQRNLANGINSLSATVQAVGATGPTSTAAAVQAHPVVLTTAEPTQAILAADIKKRAKRPAPIRNVASAYKPIVEGERVQWALSKEGRDTWTADDESQAYRGSDLPYSHQIPVAMIADDFTFGSFQPEFKTVRLKPQTWRQQMDANKPQMFICESAWQGGSPSEHPWQGKIYTSIRFKHENRKELIEILNYCHEHGIPTVFWNKEDPVHFSDRINDFIRTSALFDYVFTTAEECVELYIRDVGVPYADVLPFAVQPKLFNPIGSYGADSSVNFAGTWYARYPHRAKSASSIIDKVLASDNDMVIYDRMYSSPSKAYEYPERYKQYTRPAISYEETADAYRNSKFGITLNTVTDSKTMFARRVFELAACGVVVLSNTAMGVKHFFGDSVYYADSDDFDFSKISNAEFLTQQRNSMQIAFQNTYRHRAEQILHAVGIEHASYFDKVQLVARVDDDKAAERILAYFEANRAKFSGLLIVLTDSADQTLAMELTRKLPSTVRVIRQNEIDTRSIRSRNVLNSRKALLIDTREGSFLKEPDLAYLIDVGSSMNEAIAVTDQPEFNRFRYTRQSRPNNVLVNAEQVFPVLAERSNDSSIFLV
ncbi:CgeB family protein [Paeniglutamicibacter psychrophenolicus]|uniref:CgeB family protein n=1 Tax=Paeniglutamicibacter psychrophenolicus TaxID=257454 RepID=UPI002782AD3B|nr:glycosyltransferase [Paeniglutamicibacter psychrophenolicus]MDQ0095974.1 spore maturation protein CgeB [Paeniglutamicibacter psychrophenolicus]